MRTEFFRFEALQPSGRQLIQGWFNRAREKSSCRDEDAFEPFIYCWIAFNSWAACVTGEDSDSRIVKCLQDDPTLTTRFGDSLSQDADFGRSAELFQACWPIFRVQSLRRKGIPAPGIKDRRHVVEYYFAKGATDYLPADDGNPHPIGTEISLTWPNTLGAIYRVRCNLFHGEKCVSSEADQKIVGAAFRVLVRFFERCLRPGFPNEK